MFLRWLVFVLFLGGCSCSSSHKVMRIGIDTKWYPIDFGAQSSYVNGYIEDLLLQINQYSGIEFELISANWDALKEGLIEKKYDAILTSMQPLESNLAKFDFSNNVLDLGPVLIAPAGANDLDLKKLGGQLVGIIAQDPAALILEKYPDILIRNYSSATDLLDAVAFGEIEAALLARIPAVNYVTDLYAGRLNIVGEPLTKEGIALVTLKGNASRFNKSLLSFEKRKTLAALQKKWMLD